MDDCEDIIIDIYLHLIELFIILIIKQVKGKKWRKSTPNN